MPLYDYECPRCTTLEERAVKIAERDYQRCVTCDEPLTRLFLKAPLGKMAGRITPGGGPDRFTADMLGIPLKELPSGLKS